MSSPTKLTYDRDITRYRVANSTPNSQLHELNRILNDISNRLSEISVGSAGDGDSDFGLTVDASKFTLIESGTSMLLGLAPQAIVAGDIDFDTFTTDSLVEGGTNLFFTDERAQDAVGAMVNSTLTYTDATPELGINLASTNTWTATQTFSSIVVNDNTTLGSSNSDTINVVGRFNSSLDPATDNTYDLGRVGYEWRDLYIDGTANIDNLVADAATIGSLTGYLKGASGVVSASATIPHTDITGLGTMSTQNANAVDIDGGSIDGASIGATTPSTGAFTTLSTTGNAEVGALECGTWPNNAGFAYIGHKTLDHSVAGNYAVLQGAVGDTYVNAATGQSVQLRVNNSTVGAFSSAGLSITGTLTTTGLSSGPTKRVSSQYEIGDGTGDSARFLNVSNSSRSARISVDPANTGASTQFDIYVDGVERAKFLAASSAWSFAGNTSITGTLTTTGSAAIGTSVDANYRLTVANGAGPGSAIRAGLHTVIGQSGGEYGGVGYNVRFTTTTASYQYNVSDTACLLQFASGGFQFRTAPSGTAGNALTLTERMRITEAGNVGIGTTTPGQKLDVRGNIFAQADGAVIIVRRAGGSNYAYLGDSGATDDGALILYDSAGTVKYLLRAQGDSYLNGGNVGIGTTSPSEKLSVAGNISATTTTSTGDYYQVTDLHTIDANTGTENLTVNWSNGSVQKCQRGGNFTINTITGPSEHMVSCTLYVYDTSSIATITYPSNMRFLSTGGEILAGGAGTWVYNGFWDGSSFWVNGFARASGDQRPS